MSAIGNISTVTLADLWIGAPMAGYAANVVGIANRAFLTAFTVSKMEVVTQGRIGVVLQNGNLDIGIYDAAGNRLGSSGSTACAAANTAQLVPLTNSVTLLPGRKYWQALATNSTLASFASFNLTTPLANMAAAEGLNVAVATSFPLPDPIVIGAGAATPMYWMIFS